VRAGHEERQRKISSVAVVYWRLNAATNNNRKGIIRSLITR